MPTEPLPTSNVIELPKKPSVAEQKRIVMGRSRKAALPLIIERLRHLYRVAAPAQRRMLVGGCPTDVPIVSTKKFPRKDAGKRKNDDGHSSP